MSHAVSPPAAKSPSLFQRARRRVWIAAKWLLIGCTVLFVAFLVYDWGSAFWGGPNPRVARETTFLTEPLDEGGYVDYVAAINQKLGEGVTPESNAVVVFWRAMGPSFIDENVRGEYFALLGMEPLPLEGDYFRPLEAFKAGLAEYKNETGEWLDAAYENKGDAEVLEILCKRAAEKPWNDPDCPIVAEWLAANERAADKLIEASRRPHWYSPLAKGPNFDPAWILTIIQPEIDALQAAQYLLLARAMRKLHDGDLQGAWNDAHAQYMLARKSAGSPGELSLLVAKSLEKKAIQAMTAIALDRQATPEQIRAWLISLDNLPDQRGAAERVGFEERFRALSPYMGDVTQPASSPGRPEKRSWFVRNAVDWNRILPEINRWFDEMEEIHRLPTWSERSHKGEELFERLNAESYSAYAYFCKSTCEKLPPVFRRIRETYIRNEFQLFLPAAGAIDTSMETVATRLDLLRIVLAMRLYQFDRGKLPDHLEQLAPQYLPELPQDRFTGNPLRYLRDGDEFVIYGLGSTLKDHGGKRFRDDDPWRRANNILVYSPGWMIEEMTK